MAFKIYTKTGDKGRTSLIGGSKVSKANIRIEAYGNIDELNAFIGLYSDMAQAILPVEFTKKIQDNLFVIGSQLACAPNKEIKMQLPEISEKEIEALEKKIDEMELQLAPLKYFVLPGGNVIVSQIHVARCVCRRAERAVVHLYEVEENGNEIILKYLNRLSDYFFVLSRFVAFKLNVAENYWIPNVNTNQ